MYHIDEDEPEWELGDKLVILNNPSYKKCADLVAKLTKTNHLPPLQLLGSYPGVVIYFIMQLSQIKKPLCRLGIENTPLTVTCIEYLCGMLEKIKELYLEQFSVDDEGVIKVCNSLKHNKTLSSLSFYCNPLITSNSSEALCNLLVNNMALLKLNLKYTSLTSHSVKHLVGALNENKTLKELQLDKNHQVHVGMMHAHRIVC